MAQILTKYPSPAISWLTPFKPYLDNINSELRSLNGALFIL